MKQAVKQAKKFVIAERYDGIPKVSDFRLETFDLPEVKDGQVLLETKYLGIDAGIRQYSLRYNLGDTMIGAQIAKVIESKNPDFPVDSWVCSGFGWRTHFIFDPKETSKLLAINKPYVLRPLGSLPKSLGLGQLGMPGFTAYFGLTDVCKVKKGDAVLVSGAAGGIGYIVGQIARIKGCGVVGLAGSDEKCEWLEKEIGYHHALNYKKVNLAEVLKVYFPNGIDCYFDNVGGELTSTVLHHMNQNGRIAVCGAISTYNLPRSKWPLVPSSTQLFPEKMLTMAGFHASQYLDRRFDAIDQLKKWTEEGKLKYRETLTEGFENAPQAFIDVLQGKNIGKGIVKV